MHVKGVSLWDSTSVNVAVEYGDAELSIVHKLTRSACSASCNESGLSQTVCHTRIKRVKIRLTCGKCHLTPFMCLSADGVPPPTRIAPASVMHLSNMRPSSSRTFRQLCSFHHPLICVLQKTTKQHVVFSPTADIASPYSQDKPWSSPNSSGPSTPGGMLIYACQ